MISTDTQTLASRIASVRSRLDQAASRAGRDPKSMTVVAVSKTVGPAEIRIAYEQGLRHFGENRVADGREKFPPPQLDDLVLHFIGQLQTNKAGHAVDLFQIIESVDRLSLILELEKQASKRNLVLPVLLQVNVAGEEQKAGCDLEEAEHLVSSIQRAANLDLRGLMTMAPLVDDPESVRPVFRGLRELRDRLQESLGIALPTLSMGMTNDFLIAIEEGATHIRIGRAIFG